MATIKVTMKDKTNFEWAILLLTTIVNISIAVFALSLFFTGEIFNQIIGALLLILFLIIIFFEYQFLKDFPWGWYILYLFQSLFFLTLILGSYSGMLIDLMEDFYLIVIKGFSDATINWFAGNNEYDFSQWIDDMFFSKNSFLVTQSILLGLIIALLGIYWAISLLQDKYVEFEIPMLKQRNIILLILLGFMLLIGIVVFFSHNTLNIVLGAIIGSVGFVLVLILLEFSLSQDDKNILIKILLGSVVFIIAFLSIETKLIVGEIDITKIAFEEKIDEIFIAILILIVAITVWLLQHKTTKEKYDLLWTAEQREERTALTLVLPTIMIVIFVVLIPVIWVFIASFFDVGLANLGRGAKPAEFVGIKNYSRFLTDDEFFTALITSILYTTLGTVLSVVLGLIAAILLNRAFHGRGIIRSTMLFPYIASTVAIIALWRWALHEVFGIANYFLRESGIIEKNEPWLGPSMFTLEVFQIKLLEVHWAFIVVVIFEIWKYFPFAMLMILARLQAINKELYEAADIDGANDWQKFRHITLPELRYVIGVVVLLRTIWTFNKFDDVFLFTEGSIQTGTLVLPIYIFDKVWRGALFKISEAAAPAVFLVIGLLIFSITFGKKVLKW
ncbi:MAG: carbohydrate ABC transporter permease [Candidatus Hodarchaeales archaeon]|jgi:multiple sugar transport system permease protein